MSDIPTADWNWIDAAAWRFELAWKKGPRPRIEDFLAEVTESQRAALLAELLCVERELREVMGEQPNSAEYRRRFPEFEVVVTSVLESGQTTHTARHPGSRSRLNRARFSAANVQSGSLPPGLADNPDYEIVRKLGHGGMGVVFLAHNRLLMRDEILKVMSEHIVKEAGVRDRFLREIRAVAMLRHPNIVSAYSAFRCGDSLVFAMEYVEGLDLARMVKAKGPLPVAHVAKFGHQAALGLQHAHEHGMVHRDIKPSNLMLSRDGDRSMIKLLDFGLAKASSEYTAIDARAEGPDRRGKAIASLTSTGEMLGTPDFVAPEQIIDAQRADIRADIYSLGCTLYYLLNGRPPFASTTEFTVLQAHRSMDARPLSLIRPEVPAEMAALVSRMMAKEPAQRFQTPAEVAKALVPFFSRKATATPLADYGLAQEALREPGDTGTAVTEPGTQVGKPLTQTAGTTLQYSPPPPAANGETPLAAEPKEGSALARSNAGAKGRQPGRSIVWAIAGIAAVLLAATLVVALERLQHQSSSALKATLVAASTEEARHGPQPAGRVAAAIDAKESEGVHGGTVGATVNAGTNTAHATDPNFHNPGPPRNDHAGASPNASQVPDAKTNMQMGSRTPAVPVSAKPPDPKVSDRLTWSGTLYIARSEEKVLTQANELEKQLKDYRRAFVELGKLDESALRGEAAAVQLTHELEPLKQEVSARSTELARLTGEYDNMKRQRAEMAAIGVSFYADGFGHYYSAEIHDQQIAAHNKQIEERRASLERIKSQSQKLEAEIAEHRKPPPQGHLIGTVRGELDHWQAYRKALSDLRESVDATRRQYGELANNAEVTAELVSKNRGLPQIKFSLGPSQRFKDIEIKLPIHEEFVKSCDLRRTAKMPLTPAGGLPPDF